MKRLVHFLIRDSKSSGSVIYPDERPDEGYVGFGAFYLIGDDDTDIHDAYTFPAVREGQVVAVSLERISNTKTGYRAQVVGVGSFEFSSYRVRNPAMYTGQDNRLAGKYALRLIKPRNPEDLDRAVWEKQFYFVGYSSRMSTEALDG